MVRLFGRGRGDGDSRATRVEALRRAVRAGTYQPDVDTLAAKLIDVVGLGSPVRETRAPPVRRPPTDPPRSLFARDDGAG